MSIAFNNLKVICHIVKFNELIKKFENKNKLKKKNMILNDFIKPPKSKYLLLLNYEFTT